MRISYHGTYGDGTEVCSFCRVSRGQLVMVVAAIDRRGDGGRGRISKSVVHNYVARRNIRNNRFKYANASNWRWRLSCGVTI